MNKIQVFALDGTKTKDFEINDRILIANPHEQAVFDAVIAERSSQRQGTHSTLTKGEVRGGGKKPYKQKHTGRARQGSTRNPHYVGGGIAFGPKPIRNYSMKVNKKVSQLAFRSAFSDQLIRNAVFGLIDEANPEKPSTKAMAGFIKKVVGNKKTLVILGKPNLVIEKSSSNLQNVTLKHWNQVSTLDLLDAQAVIVQPSAINNWIERLH